MVKAFQGPWTILRPSRLRLPWLRYVTIFHCGVEDTAPCWNGVKLTVALVLPCVMPLAKLGRREHSVCISVADALRAIGKHQAVCLVREGIVFHLVLKMFSLHI